MSPSPLINLRMLMQFNGSIFNMFDDGPASFRPSSKWRFSIGAPELLDRLRQNIVGKHSEAHVIVDAAKNVPLVLFAS